MNHKKELLRSLWVELLSGLSGILTGVMVYL